MEFGLLHLLIGFVLVFLGIRDRPKERPQQSWRVSGAAHPWKYLRLPAGLLLLAIGFGIVLSPYRAALAYGVPLLMTLLAIVVHLAYLPSFAKWQDALFRLLAGKQEQENEKEDSAAPKDDNWPRDRNDHDHDDSDKV